MVKFKLSKKNTKNTIKKSIFNIYQFKFLIVFTFFITLAIAGLSAYKIGFNKGIDFAGGLVFEGTCEKCNTSKIVKEIEIKINSSVQKQTTNNGFVLKTTFSKNYDKTISIIKDIFKQNNAKIISHDFTSPQMTKTFIDDSIFACIFAFVCIGLYIIVRFSLKFAISSIITVIYDVLMVICFLSFANIEVCLITLTAILTIIGYCINDKIVVFDRIRSNLDEKGKNIQDIISESVKSVLTRSVLTSLTTIIVSFSLFFFGDRFIYELGFVIIFGIIIGTISSLLLAPSLLLIFKVKHIEHKSKIVDPMWYNS